MINVEKLIVAKLVKKLPSFRITQRANFVQDLLFSQRWLRRVLCSPLKISRFFGEAYRLCIELSRARNQH
jgi:hypothetical protein